MEFIEEQLARNIANRVAIEKSMGKEFTESDCLDLLEKAGKPSQMGEVRMWDGKEYIKTPQGWRPKPKGYKGSEKKQEVTEAGNPVGKPESVTSKKVTDKFEVGDRVMYRGKLMELTRISKDGRFQNGIEMKFVNEGDSTPTGGKTLQGNMMYAKPAKEERGSGERLKARKEKIEGNLEMIEDLDARLSEIEGELDAVGEDDARYAKLSDEYDDVEEERDNLIRKTKNDIKSFMKEADPSWKAPKNARVNDLVRPFNNVKL